MAMQKQRKRGDSRTSLPEVTYSENVTKMVAILRKILDKQEAAAKKNGSSLHPDKAKHLQNVQAMIDKLQSPLFNSLVEIQSKYNQALVNPQQTAPRPKSTALEFSRQPDLLPQFCQRYGISEVAAATAVDKLSGSFDEKRQPERAKRRSSKGETSTSGATPTSFITNNGRILPMLRKDSPKIVALANLSKHSPEYTEEKEMADLEERVVSGGIVASSTESSLSSISCEAPSQNTSSYFQQDLAGNAASPPLHTKPQSNLVLVNPMTSQELNQPTISEQGGRQYGEELEVVVIPNQAAIEGGTAGQSSARLHTSMSLSEAGELVEMEVIVKSDKDTDAVQMGRQESSSSVSNAVPTHGDVVKGEREMRVVHQMSELRVSKIQEDFGEALSSISEEFLDDNDVAQETVGNAFVGVVGTSSAGVGVADKVEGSIAASAIEKVVDELAIEEKDQLLEYDDDDGGHKDLLCLTSTDRADKPKADNEVDDEDRKSEPDLIQDEIESEEGSVLEDHPSGPEEFKDDVAHASTIREDAIGSDDAVPNEVNSNKPRDLLYCMRDRKSQTELTQVLQRTDRGTRSVALMVGSSKIGGARRVGLDIIGLSSTGVFIDDVMRESEVHQSGLLRKGDQILKVNNKDIDGKASFEVDLMLREAVSGQDVTFEVQYNPTGYSECQRTMKSLA